MNKVAPLILSALLGVMLGGCADEPGAPELDIAAMKEVIEDKNRQFTRAHVTGEVEVINAYFTNDAKIFLPNADVVTGSEAIAKLNQEYVGYGISAFSEETTALYGNEEFLIEEGTYSMTYGDDDTPEIGKYINIWKPENGEWKVHANIWNSSMPANP